MDVDDGCIRRQEGRIRHLSCDEDVFTKRHLHKQPVCTLNFKLLKKKEKSQRPKCKMEPEVTIEGCLFTH